MSIGDYVRQKYSPELPETQMAVADMTINKALVVRSTGAQYLRVTANVDWLQKCVSCSFSSADVSTHSNCLVSLLICFFQDDGNEIVHHSSCVVKYLLPAAEQWRREEAATTRSQIDSLRGNGDCYRFNRNMIYRMVAVLADFSQDYRGLKEVVLDNEALAAASVTDYACIQPMEAAGFHVHPGYIDSLSQSAGFVMNANDTSDLESRCFVNHGWKSLRVFEPLCANMKYESFVKMTCSEADIWHGTLSVIHDGRLIARFEGLELYGMPRRLLNHILSSSDREAQSLTANGHRLSMADEPRDDAFSDADLARKLDKVTDIVAVETGIGKDELTDDTELAQAGVDSLLSLILESRLKEELGFSLPSRLPLFSEYATLGDLKAGLAKSMGLSLSAVASELLYASPPHVTRAQR